MSTFQVDSRTVFRVVLIAILAVAVAALAPRRDPRRRGDDPLARRRDLPRAGARAGGRARPADPRARPQPAPLAGDPARLRRVVRRARGPRARGDPADGRRGRGGRLARPRLRQGPGGMGERKRRLPGAEREVRPDQDPERADPEDPLRAGQRSIGARGHLRRAAQEPDLGRDDRRDRLLPAARGPRPARSVPALARGRARAARPAHGRRRLRGRPRLRHDQPDVSRSRPASSPGSCSRSSASSWRCRWRS